MTVWRTNASISGPDGFCPGGTLAKAAFEASVRVWLPFWQTA